MKFGKLLQRFLHAYGALDGEMFAEKSGQELKGGMSEAIGEGGAKMQAALEEVKGGGLLIDEAHLLGGEASGGVRAPVLPSAQPAHHTHSSCEIRHTTCSLQGRASITAIS